METQKESRKQREGSNISIRKHTENSYTVVYAAPPIHCCRSVSMLDGSTRLSPSFSANKLSILYVFLRLYCDESTRKPDATDVLQRKLKIFLMGKYTVTNETIRKSVLNRRFETDRRAFSLAAIREMFEFSFIRSFQIKILCAAVLCSPFKADNDDDEWFH